MGNPLNLIVAGSRCRCPSGAGDDDLLAATVPITRYTGIMVAFFVSGPGLNLAGDAGGAMTKYWVFTQGGAWRNLKPTGNPYICEQCRLDARSKSNPILTLQTVTEIELAPTDVCGDCGARLLEEGEAQDRA